MRAASTGGGQGAILRGSEEVPRLLERHDHSPRRVGHRVRGLEAEEEGSRGDRGQEALVLRRPDQRRGEQNHRGERDSRETGEQWANTWKEEEGEAEEDQKPGRTTASRPREGGRERRGDKKASRPSEEDSPAAEATGKGDEGTGAATAAATPEHGSLRRRLRYRCAYLFLVPENVRAHGPLPAADQRLRILRTGHQRQSLQPQRETESRAFATLQPKPKVHVALVHSLRFVLGDQHRDLLGEQPRAIAVDLSERRASGLRAAYQHLPAEHEQRSSSVQSSW